MAVDTSFFKSWLSEEIRAEVTEEIRAEERVKAFEEIRAEMAHKIREERAKTREELRTEGSIHVLTKDILHLLDRRDIPLTDADRERVTSCKDLDTLARWFDRAITAVSAAEVFTEDEPGDEESGDDER